MKADQYARLKALSDRLIDKFLDEADPNHWPGAGVEIAAQTKDQRGDAVWCKKSASVTISLVLRIESVTRAHEGHDPTAPPIPADGTDTTDSEIASMEKQAGRILADVQARARGKAKG